MTIGNQFSTASTYVNMFLCTHSSIQQLRLTGKWDSTQVLDLAVLPKLVRLRLDFVTVPLIKLPTTIQKFHLVGALIDAKVLAQLKQLEYLYVFDSTVDPFDILCNLDSSVLHYLSLPLHANNRVAEQLKRLPRLSTIRLVGCATARCMCKSCP